MLNFYVKFWTDRRTDINRDQASPEIKGEVTCRVEPVLTPGASYEQINRSPQGDAAYQISKIYTFQFQRRKILKMGFFERHDPFSNSS